MTDYITEFVSLQNQLEKLIKKQMTIGYFIDWEDWLKEHFNPLNDQYKNIYEKLEIKPKYIDFSVKVNLLIFNDCDMKNYE